MNYNNQLSYLLGALNHQMNSYERLRTDIINVENLSDLKSTFTNAVEELTLFSGGIPSSSSLKFLFPEDTGLKDITDAIATLSLVCNVHNETVRVGCVSSIEDLPPLPESDELIEHFVSDVKSMNRRYFECAQIAAAAEYIARAARNTEARSSIKASLAALAYAICIWMAFRLEFNGIETGIKLPDITPIISAMEKATEAS